MVFEIDGTHHQTDKRQRFIDRERDERLRVEQQVIVHRFTNEEVATDSFGAALKIVDLCLAAVGRERKESRADLQDLWDLTNVEAFSLGYLEPLRGLDAIRSSGHQGLSS